MQYRDFFAGLTGGTGYSFLCADFLSFNRNFYDDLFTIVMIFLAAFASTIIAALGRELKKRYQIWKRQNRHYSKPNHRPFR